MNVVHAIKWFVRKKTLNSGTHKQCANIHSIADFWFVCFKRCYNSFPYSAWYFTKRCTIKRNSFNAQNKDFLALNNVVDLFTTVSLLQKNILTIESIWVSSH